MVSYVYSTLQILQQLMAYNSLHYLMHHFCRLEQVLLKWRNQMGLLLMHKLSPTQAVRIMLATRAILQPMIGSLLLRWYGMALGILN